MLDGIQAAEMLRGVRGEPAVDREALAAIIERVSRLGQRLPRDQRSRPQSGLRHAKGATAVDVRILVDFDPPAPRPRPSQDEIVRAMNRIMRPDAVAVIGASGEAGKIGNSVMKNLINGGYKGQIYPINPKADEDPRYKAYKSVKDIPGNVDVAIFAIPAQFVAAALTECGEKKIPGAGPHPVGFAETGNVAGQEEIVEIGRRYKRALDGSEHLRLLLHAEGPVRDLLHGLTT